MSTTKRNHGCLFIVIAAGVFVVYMSYGKYGPDRSSDPVANGKSSAVLPARWLLDNHFMKQGTRKEKYKGGYQPAFVRECRELFPQEPASTNHFPVMNVKKTTIYYCGIPKVGTTFTKLLLKKIPKCQRNGMCELDVPTAKLRKHPISERTFSFMWIRDPYSRLFSAYENKLYHPNAFWQSLGREIIRVIRTESAVQTQKWKWSASTLGYDVTFAEFIRFILVSSVKGESLNIHFKPMHKICNPCTTRFDFIGRMESFSESVNQVCSKFSETGLLDSENGTIACNSTPPDTYVFSRVGQLFYLLTAVAHIPNSVYKELMLRTWTSYQMRGMVSKTLDLPWSDDELRSVTHDQYLESLRAAMKVSSNKTEVQDQRREALVQAYRTVPMADMALLKEYVSTDCRLFGYDVEPEDLFKPRQMITSSEAFDYFNGLLG